MLIEVAGAEITSAMIEVIETLQTDTQYTRLLVNTIEDLARRLSLDTDLIDGEDDSRVLAQIRVLQMIRRDLLTLASPPDIADEENDKPVARL